MLLIIHVYYKDGIFMSTFDELISNYLRVFYISWTVLSVCMYCTCMFALFIIFKHQWHETLLLYCIIVTTIYERILILKGNFVIFYISLFLL